MNDKLKPNQEKIIIKNCVESIMEDLDDYYFDELFMKQYKKRLIEFFTKISEEHSLFSPGFDFSNKKNIVNDKEKVEAIKKTLSLNIQGLMTYSRYVGLIHDIMDDKMTMKQVDVYIKDNFEPNSSKSDS